MHRRQKKNNEKWLKKEDSIYEELRAYVDSELAEIQEKYLY